MSIQQIKQKLIFAVLALGSQEIEDARKRKTIFEIGGNVSVTTNERSFLDYDVMEKKATVLGLTIEGLSFAYEKNKMVLNDINMNIEKGKKYLIIGADGSGKSTLLDILLKKNKDYIGNVFLGKDDLKKVKPTDLNNTISVVSSNVPIINDTIYNNVALNSNDNDRKVWDSMGKVGLRNNKENLVNAGNGAESNESFSNGDKKKISIARALVKNSSILVIDETTESSDNKVDYEIEELILNMREMTVLSFSRKLSKSLIDKYDKIFVLDQGRLVEEGTFSDLLLNNEYFYKMYFANENLCDNFDVYSSRQRLQA
ncbi:MAG: ATP-binding cassette domain-containing protein [Clostridiaceae bacterium]